MTRYYGLAKHLGYDDAQMLTSIYIHACRHTFTQIRALCFLAYPVISIPLPLSHHSQPPSDTRNKRSPSEAGTLEIKINLFIPKKLRYFSKSKEKLSKASKDCDTKCQAAKAHARIHDAPCWHPRVSPWKATEPIRIAGGPAWWPSS